jgi:formylglycine-generating enzyme required for sulfatase activity
MIKNTRNIIAVVALALATLALACTKEENAKPSNGDTPNEDLEEDEEEIDWDDPHTGQKATVYVEDVKFEMIYVEKGTFRQLMPHYRQDPLAGRVFDTAIAEDVTIEEDFLIGKYEVTQRQWLTIVADNPSEFHSDPDLPVTNIDMWTMVRFADTLSQRTGYAFRLPTPYEWQYAAMGGRRSLHYLYAGGNYIGEVAWYAQNSGGTTHRVGQLKPNELGLYDMCGNVSEATTGDGAAERGGAFDTELDLDNVDFRNDLKVQKWYLREASNWFVRSDNNLGFRLAMSASDAKKAMQNKGKNTKTK